MNGYIFIAGGCISSTGGSCNTNQITNTVERAQIMTDGTLGAWSYTTAALPTNSRILHWTVAHKGYIYVVGGCTTYDCNSSLVKTVTRGQVTAGGDVTSWTDQTPSGTFSACEGHGVAVYNDFMYMLGGNCPVAASTQTVYAAINTSDGSVGSFSAASNAFSTARFGPSVTVHNGYIYVMGGCTNSGACITTGLNDVQYAPLDPVTGDVGTWNTTNSFTGARYNASVVTANGFMCLIGGYQTITPAGHLATTQCASIGPNGTLSSWQASSSYSTARLAQGAVLYNGYLYVVGGLQSAGTVTQSVQIAGHKAIARKGTYSYAVDWGADAVATKLLYRGSLSPGEEINFMFTDATSSSPGFGSATSVSTLSSNSLYSLTATEKRYRWLQFALDDSHEAVFPDTYDATSHGSTITDFELWYHAATAKRLRGGKNFLQQVQSNLDITPN